MSYAKQTIQNRSAIKKFSHQKRFDVAVALTDPKPGDHILDFGTGDGYLLKCLAEAASNIKLYGYEPVDKMYTQLESHMKSLSLDHIRIEQQLDLLPKAYFHTISCMEVLEHFSEPNQKIHLQAMKALLAPGGKLIVSVPLETGLSALFKNLVRMAVGQQHGLSSTKNLIRAVFGMKIRRKDTYYINSHIGFNHKALEKVFKAEGFKIIKKRFSPFRWLFGVLNSQVFYILTA